MSGHQEHRRHKKSKLQRDVITLSILGNSYDAEQPNTVSDSRISPKVTVWNTVGI